MRAVKRSIYKGTFAVFALGAMAALSDASVLLRLL